MERENGVASEGRVAQSYLSLVRVDSLGGFEVAKIALAKSGGKKRGQSPLLTLDLRKRGKLRMNARFHPVCPASLGTLKIPVPPAVKLAAATGARPALDPDVIAAEIVEDFQTALAQLKLARCPQSLTPSLAALPSMSLIPFTPMIRSRPRGS